jgi:hypothetical protein
MIGRKRKIEEKITKGNDSGIILLSLQENGKKSKKRKLKELTLDLQVKDFF